MFQCDCGKEKVIRIKNVKSGNTQSCGCIAREVLMNRSITHGLTISHPREYRAWKEMRLRCSNEHDVDWKDYGGRGISVCDRWQHGDGKMSAPECFVLDMGRRPPRTSLDRIDVNGNYEPENCRWADAKQQASNKRTNVFIDFRGETHTITEWCRRLCVERTRVQYRMKVGMSFEEAIIETDLRKTNTNRRRLLVPV
jgi:hypothetical protein